MANCRLLADLESSTLVDTSADRRIRRMAWLQDNVTNRRLNSLACPWWSCVAVQKLKTLPWLQRRKNDRCSHVSVGNFQRANISDVCITEYLQNRSVSVIIAQCNLVKLQLDILEGQVGCLGAGPAVPYLEAARGARSFIAGEI
jgi:hypothetical protein